MKSLVAIIAMVLTLSGGLAENSKVLEKRVATTAKQKIEINGFSGSKITFRSWPNNEVYIRLNVYISSSDKNYEREYIERIKISEIPSDGVLRLQLEAPKESGSDGFSIWNIFKRFYVEKEISGDIYIPQSNPLSTDLRYGSLTLENMKGAVQLLGTSNTVKLMNCASVQEIENNYGKTWITGSGGALRLTGTSSTVNIKDFIGSVNVDADYSTVIIDNVEQSVSVSDKSGKIFIDNIHGDATLNADYSTISMNVIDGFADIRSTSGSVSVRQVGGIQVNAKYTNVSISKVSGTAGKLLIINGQSGKVVLQDVVGDVQIDNPYSPITLNRIKGDVDIATTSSTISAEDIAGDWTCRSQYTGIDVRGLTAKKVAITNSSNTIDLALKIVPAAIDIKNQYGSVKVRMPVGYSGSVDMNAEYGTISTTLPVKTKTMSSSAYAVGKVGSGTGSITIETKSGNILLEER
jgi:hypothetical protein